MTMALTRRVLAAAVGRGADRPRAPDPGLVLSALPVPVVLLDSEDRFLFVNHAAEQFLGMSAAQLTQCCLADIVPPDNPIFLLIAQVRQGR